MSANLTGTTILHYRILRPVGSGGMGVVYEAEDTKLGRRVALKFLPPELARDQAALERFRREARAASALNHPHICTVHAIEDAGGAPFISMELLEGESLDRRIADGPLPWDALVETGIQVADALEAAHRRGILHRDIKPANIFVTPDGRAKVLDFGVAKIAAERVAQAETVGAATPERALTGEGVAVGTIAYMSPEQARGEQLDARTDVFSFAAVLYEMSTGRRAFEGNTSAVVFQKILDGAPVPPRELNPTLPLKLEDVIQRGLEKDRALRYQSAADLRADLARLKRDATSGTVAFVAPRPGAAAGLPLSSGAIVAGEARRHKGLAGIAAVLLLALIGSAGYGLYAFLRRPDPAPPAAGSDAMTLTRLTTSGNVRSCGSISPDGKFVVYCDFDSRLVVRQVATGATVTIAKDGGVATTFSPDGNVVYATVFDEANPDGVVRAIPSLGGEARRVVRGVLGPVGVSPDGQRIVFVRENAATRSSALVITDVFGGNERGLAEGSFESAWINGHTGVSWSHDGRLLAAAQAVVIGGYRMRPVVVHADSGRVELLGDRTWPELGRVTWLPGNRSLLFTARERIYGAFQFWIMRYPEGTARRITNDARGFGNISVSVTADGSTIATIPVEEIANIWSTNGDATAPLVQWTSGVRRDGDSGIALTAGTAMYYASWDGTEMGIWSVDRPAGQPRKLTRDYAEIPSAPADGRFVVYQALHENHYRIWRMDPDGSGARVLSHGEDDLVPVVSHDGQWIYYSAAGEARLVRMSADGGDAATVTTMRVWPIGLSPDSGTLLVRAQDSSAGWEYGILDTQSGQLTTRLALPSGARAGWGRRPDLIAYALERDGVTNLWEQPLAGGAARQLTKFTSGHIFHFKYSADGSQLVLARGQRTGDVYVIRNFQ